MSAFGHDGSAPFNRPAAVVFQALPTASSSHGWRVVRSGPEAGSVRLVRGLLALQDLVDARIEALTPTSCRLHAHSRPRWGPLFARFPDLGYRRGVAERLLDAVKDQLQAQGHLTEVFEPPDPRWEA